MPDEHAPTPPPPQDQTQQTPPTSQTPPQQTPPAPKPTPTPTPPGDVDCPPPKECVDWPAPPCPPTKKKPDPCDDDIPDDCEPPEPDPTAPPVKTGNCCELPAAGDDPTKQIEALRAQLAAEHRQADQIDRVKASIEDLTTRISDLQKVLDGKTERADGFKEFYRTTQVTDSEIGCSIPTIRCQLNLTPGETTCVTTAITGVDAAIKKAKDKLDAQQGLVDRSEARLIRATWNAKWAQKQFDFLESKLKERVQTQLDDLAALKVLADPSGNRCVAEFYLREMEALLASCYGDDGSACCWLLEKMTVGSFVDCWSEGCYAKMYNRAVVENNNAAWTLKCRTALHDSAKKRLEEYQKTYDELAPRRRELILAALKASDCCKSTT